jgi:hypothetical protein
MGSFTPMNILVLGVVRIDVPNLFQEIHDELHRSQHRVTQMWAEADAPKFTMLNSLWANTSWVLKRASDYVIVIDDDIQLPHHFLDRYIEVIERYDFALAQPARTSNSTIHHPIVEQQTHCIARQTRFVEIGPLFSVRADAFDLIFPFDETSPMGWGYDFAWPVQMEQAGLKMGIVDALAVDHSFRPNISYDLSIVSAQANDYLSKHKHLAREDAYTELHEHLFF